MKVAAIQLNVGEFKDKNIAKAVHFVKDAIEHGAKAVFLPEVFNYRGPLNKNILAEISEGIPGPSLKPLMELAKKHRAFIVAGSIYERIPKSTKVYNTSVVINDYGRITTRYRKIHLFDAVVVDRVVKEAQNFSAGKAAVIAPFGPMRLGMTVCYDLRFPDLFRKYGKKKCEIISVPSNFTFETGKAHWEVLLRARAIENLSYIVAANQCGQSSTGVAAFGNSMIVDPWGGILARASAESEEIIFAQLQREALEYTRAILPTILR
jgi:predicted amidohydrolase